MAVMTRRRRHSFRSRPLTRKLLGLSALLTCVTQPGLAQPETAAPATEAVKPLDAEILFRFAHSSATIQARASELAATRDTRPEAKAFARRMVEFRRGHVPKLEAIAHDNKLDLPKQLEVEHRVIFQNLEPLDYLALTRRYAEFQVQALEQEIQIYGSAASATDTRMRGLAAETIPELRRRLDEARAVRQAVGP